MRWRALRARLGALWIEARRALRRASRGLRALRRVEGDDCSSRNHIVIVSTHATRNTPDVSRGPHRAGT